MPSNYGWETINLLNSNKIKIKRLNIFDGKKGRIEKLKYLTNDNKEILYIFNSEDTPVYIYKPDEIKDGKYEDTIYESGEAYMHDGNGHYIKKWGSKPSLIIETYDSEGLNLSNKEDSLHISNYFKNPWNGINFEMCNSTSEYYEYNNKKNTDISEFKFELDDWYDDLLIKYIEEDNTEAINEIIENIMNDFGEQPITDLLKHYNVYKYQYKGTIVDETLEYDDDYIIYYIDKFKEVQYQIYRKINDMIDELFITIDKQISASEVIQKYWKKYKQ
jgi:hypothetical protein